MKPPAKRRLREYLAAAQPPAITEAVWLDLLTKLAPVSENYLRELLRQTELPFDLPYAGIRQHTFEELEQSLREMLLVYMDAMAAGDRGRARYCRRQVIGAKDRARRPHRAGKEGAEGRDGAVDAGVAGESRSLPRLGGGAQAGGTGTEVEKPLTEPRPLGSGVPLLAHSRGGMFQVM